MTRIPVAIACRLVEAWVRVYTLGLPAASRHDRIDLIRADLHDHLSDAHIVRFADPVVAVALLSRGLRGAADDLTWRLFDAGRRPTDAPTGFAGEFERRQTMPSRTIPSAFFAVAAGVSWAAALVLALEPVPHSLSYGGGLLALIALVAWTLEARASDSDEAGLSAWPLLLAIGIVVVAAGAVFGGGRTGMAVLAPMAAGLSAVLARRLAVAAANDHRSGLPPTVSPAELAMHAGAGDAIAIEKSPVGGVTRRALLRGGFGVGLASVFAAMGGVMVDFLWQRNVAGFGGVVTAGLATDFPPGTKTRVHAGKFWLVNLTPEQGGPGYLALWQKCPHLGCVVPWDPNFSFTDPQTGDRTRGWFRCPCHQSTYDHAGVRVYGPAPRSMDRMALRINEEGYIEVDTADIEKGTDDNAAYAVRE